MVTVFTKIVYVVGVSEEDLVLVLYAGPPLLFHRYKPPPLLLLTPYKHKAYMLQGKAAKRLRVKGFHTVFVSHYCHLRNQILHYRPTAVDAGQIIIAQHHKKLAIGILK